MKVCKAYLFSAGEAKRVLLSNRGKVFAGKDWEDPNGKVVSTGDVYERWSDVPFAWMGGTPWWR